MYPLPTNLQNCGRSIHHLKITRLQTNKYYCGLWQSSKMSWGPMTVRVWEEELMDTHLYSSIRFHTPCMVSMVVLLHFPTHLFVSEWSWRAAGTICNSFHYACPLAPAYNFFIQMRKRGERKRGRNRRKQRKQSDQSGEDLQSAETTLKNVITQEELGNNHSCCYPLSFIHVVCCLYKTRVPVRKTILLWGTFSILIYCRSLPLYLFSPILFFFP